MKPESNRVDLESLKTQLREEFSDAIRDMVEEEINQILLAQEGEEEFEQQFFEEVASENVAILNPVNSLKFRGSDGQFKDSDGVEQFGKVLLSSDGTSTVDVVGRIVDEQEGVQSYRIRVKRVDI